MNSLGPADIRHANMLACLRALRIASDPLSISEIATTTALSRPTVEAVINGFEERGLVIAAAASGGTSAGGRPARRYDFAATSALVAGIDAGPSNIRVLVADLRGRVMATASTAVQGTPSAGERLDLVASVIAEAVARTGLESPRLSAACVGVSGIVGDDGRLVDSFAVPEWNGAAIADDIAERFGCDALLENDIKLAAYAEHHMGAAQDVDDTLFIQIGNRISLSQIVGGRIFQGAHRSAGEVSSLRGMRWTRTSHKGQLTWRSGETGEQVLALASAGDADALDEVRALVEEIAPLLTTVSLVIDPARIVVGGGLSATGEIFVDMLRTRMHHLIVLADKPEVSASPLGSIGTAAGALALAFQSGSERLFGIADAPVPTIALPENGVAAS